MESESGDEEEREELFCATEHANPAQSLLFILIIDRERQKCPSANPLSFHNADSVTEAPVLM